MMDRRVFLKGLGAAVGLVAVPTALVVPERRIWQVPSNAPVRSVWQDVPIAHPHSYGFRPANSPVPNVFCDEVEAFDEKKYGLALDQLGQLSGKPWRIVAIDEVDRDKAEALEGFVNWQRTNGSLFGRNG